jgi:sarcosine oxidase subunit alpha
MAYSPELGCSIALAFLKRGPARHGERIRVLDRMRGLDIEAEVCGPVFVDPEGERLRG